MERIKHAGWIAEAAACMLLAVLVTAAQAAEIGTTENREQVSRGGLVDESGQTVVLGDERADVYLPLLSGKQVALFSNQSGIVGNRILNRENSLQSTENSLGNTEKSSQNREKSSDPAIGEGLLPFGKNPDGSEVVYGEHILDVLVRQGVDVTVVFSPEHGFRGTADAGAQVGDSIDEKTGIPVHSLYGGGSMPLSAEDLGQFDVLVVDIQDVGLRYYTYYITLYSLMDACASAGKEVVILDRPNPNGFYVDGPILQPEFASGVGLLPLPVVHGMTMGELAQMINGEGWLASGKGTCDLTVVSCENYTHRTRTALVTRPSPNLKDMRAVYLYASTCFFENTAFSVGRGTEYPFELYGSPYLQDSSLSEDAFSFIPVSMEGAVSPPFEGQECFGRDLREIPLARIMQEQIDLRYLLEAREALLETRPDISFFGTPDGAGHYWIDYLFGTDEVRRQIEDGSSAAEIEASWQEDVEEFCRQRRPYLLYAE